MSRDPTPKTEGATNASSDTNTPHGTTSGPVAEGPPDWIGGVLTERQVSDLNPSFLWLKVALSERVELTPRAKNVAAVLYSCAYVDGGRFDVGTRRLADMLCRDRRFVAGGVDDLAREGFLVVHESGKGQRNGYQLSLPIDPPSGAPDVPRRTGGTGDAPRRTAPPNEGSGAPDVPGWSMGGTTTGAPDVPRRATDQREQQTEPVSVVDLEAFVASTLSADLAPDHALSIASHEVRTRPDHWRQRMQREHEGGSGAVDRFIDAIDAKVRGDAHDKLQRERQRTNRKLADWFTATGTDPSVAARVVTEKCDLNKATTSVLGLAHKVLTEQIGAAA